VGARGTTTQHVQPIRAKDEILAIVIRPELPLSPYKLIWEGCRKMPKSKVPLPAAIGAKVRIQSADMDGFQYLAWRGFFPETIEFGGYCTMRRDFQDWCFAHYPEPPPPRFGVTPVS